jgi:hypothetical protein
MQRAALFKISLPAYWNDTVTGRLVQDVSDILPLDRRSPS